jgi:hypothetical protein
VRPPTNTLDLRGARVEGRAGAARIADDAMLSNQDAVFVLHGHGTGAARGDSQGLGRVCLRCRFPAPPRPECFTVALRG